MPESSTKLSSQIKIDLLIFRSSLKQCWSQNFIYLTQKTKICCTIAFQINRFTLQTREQLVHYSGLRGLKYSAVCCVSISHTCYKPLVHSYCTTSPPITHAPVAVCQLVQVGSWYGFNSVLVYLRLLVVEGLLILESDSYQIEADIIIATIEDGRKLFSAM